MDISIPKERRPFEYRVGLTPAGVELLVRSGHRVFVEREAGMGAGFSDEDYRRAGAILVYSGEEAFKRARLIVKVARPTEEEVAWLHEGQIVMGFMHLASARRSRLQALLETKATVIAYETIQREDGTLPVLMPISEIAGRMVAQVAARLLQNDSGGNGVLLGGVPGVPPAEVVILGAGVVGRNAARAFLGLGASVYMLDKDLAQLQAVDELFGGRVVTMLSHEFNVRKMTRFADVLVGAVLVPGARAPIVVTREMVRAMRPRSVIIDVSIDQGGCVETSRPTIHSAPTFVEEGVLHYCVPNITGVVARTATHALNNAVWPFIQQIADEGLEAALMANTALRHGVNVHGGRLTHPALIATYPDWPSGEVLP